MREAQYIGIISNVNLSCLWVCLVLYSILFGALWVYQEMKTVLSLSNVTIFKVNNLILVHKLLVSHVPYLLLTHSASWQDVQWNFFCSSSTWVSLMHSTTSWINPEYAPLTQEIKPKSWSCFQWKRGSEMWTTPHEALGQFITQRVNTFFDH